MGMSCRVPSPGPWRVSAVHPWPRVLPGHHLWPRPVDVEDLRPSGLQLGKVLVEAALLDLSLLVLVAVEILADLGEPPAGPCGREDPPHDRAAGLSDGPARGVRDSSFPDVGIVELGHHGPA